jgi:MFS transporter, ACS family, hexuronate transporter
MLSSVDQDKLAIQSPSALRQWAPCIAMLLLGFLSYVDRSVLAILSPTILAALHLSATQYGYAILVFSLCYMLANPIWGFLMDRAGLWLTTFAAVSIWSTASGSHGLILGFVSLCVARGVLGFGEGATFPASLKTVTETLPVSKRSFGLGVAYSGGSLGAALTLSAHHAHRHPLRLALRLRHHSNLRPGLDHPLALAPRFRLVHRTSRRRFRKRD